MLHTMRTMSIYARVFQIVLTAATATLLSWDACAEPPHAPSTTQTDWVDYTLSDLEKAFWVCDYAATVHGVDYATAILCVAATDALKKRKFDNDFHAMHAWWRQNKVRQHRALDNAYSATGKR